MAKTNGFYSLVCDRCGAQEYAAEGSPTDQTWKSAGHTNADGSQSSRYLCPRCFNEYRAMAMRQDAEYNAFMAGTGGDDADNL